MLYTRKGDSGTSGLFGTTQRFPKDSPLYDALGTLDELNSLIGMCRARTRLFGNAIDMSTELSNVQEALFMAQAELAGADQSIPQEALDKLEATIDCIERSITSIHSFVVPGATESSAMLDYARSVARRAERTVLAATHIRNLSPSTCAYLNRLSSFLFALARYTAHEAGQPETSPTYR